MELVSDVTTLHPKQQLVTFVKGVPRYYEFLMMHPHNDNYCLCINSITQNADMLYIPTVLKDFYQDYTPVDVLIHQIEWHRHKIDILKSRLNSLH